MLEGLIRTQKQVIEHDGKPNVHLPGSKPSWTVEHITVFHFSHFYATLFQGAQASVYDSHLMSSQRILWGFKDGI